MSRPDVMHDLATAYVTDTSADGVRHLSSLGMSVHVRRENLLGLAKAVHAYPGHYTSPEHQADLRKCVRYYATAADPAPAWGRLLRAVRDADAAEADKALSRLVAVAE